MSYDSAEDTRKHIFEVAARLNCVSEELYCRGRRHDESKFGDAEKPLFDLVVPRLKDLVWGSDHYKEEIRALGPAERHHYSHNSHHPEHYENGVSGMDLIDVIEMYCAGRRRR